MDIFGSHSLLVGTLIPFVFVVTVVVFVHEIGHYLVGRWCGIGATGFSIGFGPELVGFTDRCGTRWKLCVIPLGGYVKFVGDQDIVNSFSEPMEEEANETERAIAFNHQPVWKRVVTVFAGPAFNIFLAIVIFSISFMLYGRVIADPIIAEVQPNSPAAAAGFKPGDRFLMVNGEKVTTFADVQRYVSSRAGDPIHFTLERNGEEMVLTATPKLVDQIDPLGNKIRIGVIGIINNELLGKSRILKYGPFESVTQAGLETGYVIRRTGDFFVRFFRGHEDKCQLSSPVKIANMAGQAARHGFDWLIQLTAMLSIGIGLLNLFPLPPLDGGHLVFYAAEAVLGHPLSPIVHGIFSRIGFIVLFTFMGFVLFNDIFAC